MKCTSCGHENPATARFCNGCGQHLPAHCGSCGIENPSGARFCNQFGAALKEAEGPKLNVQSPRLGTSANTIHPSTNSGQAQHDSRLDPRAYTPKHLADKILQSKSALEGERKQVTVLFADVKGSMELAEQLDPEAWHAILDRFFAILTDGVHRSEGTVNQYTGDGIMALFGAPIAHENHAQRACYALNVPRLQSRIYLTYVRAEGER